MSAILYAGSNFGALENLPGDNSLNGSMLTHLVVAFQKRVRFFMVLTK